jgi:hypothetical protein
MPKIAFLPILMLWLGLYDIQRNLPGDRRDDFRS